MPELHFKGKEFVYNHHLTVPFRPLVPDPKKSCGSDSENLIIHGDNLHALKSLLPRYAGKVDLVFIDPPYNTGNEGWAYNDNVNSPMLKEWLDGNPVNGEDMLRHDKWLCMMWPRLMLLRELLSEHGSIWITLNDNEVHRARTVLDEIFGDENLVACFIWRKVDSPNDNKVSITPDHDYVLCYAKDKTMAKFSPMFDPSILEGYSRRDEQGRLCRDRLLKKNGKNSLRRDRPSMFFALTDPDGNAVFPIHDNGEEARWAAGTKAVEQHVAHGTLIWKRKEKLGKEVWEPYTREFAPEVPTRPYPTLWTDLSTMRQAQAMLREMFGTGDVFATPKPVELIERIIALVNTDNALVLDSFAGSGTTAHAVLRANAADGGKRKFVLVEGEDYADTLTAERMRRVINGYAFTGTQREELMREKITLTHLKKASQLLDKVALVEQQNAGRFDAIKSTVKHGELIVTGEKEVKKKTGGLGGGFTYCTLGDKLEIDDLLTGKSLPSFEAFGGYLFHTATGQTLEPAKIREGEGYLGESAQYHVWLVYKPELDYLKSRDASLTLSLAERIAATDRKKHHLVFAPARFVPQKTLLELGVEHAPLPYALYRIEKA